METLPDETRDHLIGDWDLFQLAKGHRTSTDDLVTAWRAGQVSPDARRYLDIGCGIGSVGLSTLWQLPRDATLTGVEAQEVSVGLFRRSIEANGIGHRVRVFHGDLRDPAALRPDECFELITGSPPYIPVGHGILPAHPQKAACRFEMRGSVFGYCEAARRWLAPGGRFVFVMSARDPRTEAAPPAAGLQVVERVDYVFRAGDPPMIATLVCAHEEESAGKRVDRTLRIRDEQGSFTAEYLAAREDMGLLPYGTRRGLNAHPDGP